MKRLKDISQTLARKFSTVSGVAISTRKTPPRTGSHLREIACIHAATNATVLNGFNNGMRRIETVSDLRSHYASHVSLPHRRFLAREIVVFDDLARVMHGGRRIC